MTIYPTLTDLCGIPTPKHVQGESIRKLLSNPNAGWDHPALTTYRFMNHSVRTEGWRYIRYADGGEELYDHAADPYEWTNLAKDDRHADAKKALARQLPTTNNPELPRQKAKGKARNKE